MFNVDNYKKDIIEAYILVYGEEYRSIIEDRINNENIIIEMSNKDLKRLINNQINNKLRDLNVNFYKTFIKDFEIDLDELRPNIDNNYSVDDYLPLLSFDDVEDDLEDYINDPYYKIIKEHLNDDLYKKYQREFTEYRESIIKKYQKELAESLEEQIENIAIKNKYERIVEELNRKKNDPEIASNFKRYMAQCRLGYQREILLNNRYVKNNPMLQELIKQNTFKIYSPIYGGRVCQLNLKLNDEIKPTIIMPLTSDNDQSQDFTLVHELGHCISTNEEGIVGIENSIIMGDNIERNDINPEKRKYEIMNEALTNIFALRANRIMQEKGQFVFEDDCTSFDYGEENDLENSIEFIIEPYLLPLVNLIEDDVKKAMINSDQSYIRNIITDEKFEQLNNLINRRYALSHSSDDDLSNDDYNKQVMLLDDELNKLYDEIKKIVKKKNNKIES